MQREEILAEMRRTAEENGGKPLGAGRFERATGIKPYDWQRYWVRFSDIQREAGFEPNTLTKAYEDSYLLERLALLTRELGGYPTKPELQRKVFNDPTFPARGTFERLGRKSEIMRKVIEFCSGREDYEDVLGILQEGGISDEQVMVNAGTKEEYGFVYLVRGHPGEYKIGRTNLVDRRLSELGATASIEQKLIHEIKTDDPAGVEHYWHRRFQDKRMKGEWFKLSAADVKAFTRWRRIY